MHNFQIKFCSISQKFLLISHPSHLICQQFHTLFKNLFIEIFENKFVGFFVESKSKKYILPTIDTTNKFLKSLILQINRRESRITRLFQNISSINRQCLETILSCISFRQLDGIYSLLNLICWALIHIKILIFFVLINILFRNCEKLLINISAILMVVKPF